MADIAKLVSWLGVSACLLLGCASQPPSAARSDLLHDDWFALGAGIASQVVAPAQVLKLSAHTEEALDRATARKPGATGRVEVLMEAIFGPRQDEFAYVSAQTTPAEQTFQQRSGDCLSLALMTLAVADRLGLDAQLQEVHMTPVWQRQGGVEFVAGHVNVLLRGVRLENAPLAMLLNEVEIDFDPATRRATRGFVPSMPVSRQRGLAMFYNNNGAEAFAAGQTALAYAHYRQAVQLDPTLDSTWFNLGQLYRAQGQDAAAQEVMRHVLSLNPESYNALLALQQLLGTQGRAPEAALYASRVQALRERDPNQLYRRGTAQLAQGDVRGAIRSLERATHLAIGFEEVHVALRDAYSSIGDFERARTQGALLAELDRGRMVGNKLLLLKH